MFLRPKNAIKEFRKRLLDNSGNVVYLSLLVLDSLMKNCTSDVHAEVLSVEFMGVMKTVVTTNKVGVWFPFGGGHRNDPNCPRFYCY